MKALFDTNILVDYLNGATQARRELQRYSSVSISMISWMEVLVGAADSTDDQRLRNFLARFELIPIDRPISERAISIRRENKIRLPDAIIWATATHLSALLVTRNIRDFPGDDPGIRVPYRLT